MYTIFKVASKQFIAKKNQIIYVDKLNFKINSLIEFKKILLISENEKFFLGNPYIENRKIVCLILKHLRTDKINVLKFKRRKHYLKRYNDRQLITKLKILNII